MAKLGAQICPDELSFPTVNHGIHCKRLQVDMSDLSLGFNPPPRPKVARAKLWHLKAAAEVFGAAFAAAVHASLLHDAPGSD